MWSVLWRVWKWLVHLVTGKSEIQRMCESTVAVELKSIRFETSLRCSRSPALRGVVVSSTLKVDEAVTLIAREKLLNFYASPQLNDQLQACLIRIRGVRTLWSEVDGLRGEAYCQDNSSHEEMLLTLWSQLMPAVELSSRVTKQWQDIGFQGDNPATDFRGMGVLSLHCLLYLTGHHLDEARQMLSHSHHPQHGYPFAVVAIDMTGLLYSLLEEGALNWHFYCTALHWPLPLNAFMDIFCYLFYSFDCLWVERCPDNVMQFPALRAEFLSGLRQQLAPPSSQRSLTLSQH